MSIVRVMTEHGFTPSQVHDPSCVEFFKDYLVDDQGRKARAVVRFAKHQEIPHLMGFHVTVQATIEPTVEAVGHKSPPIMRTDLLSVTRAFTGDALPDAVVLKACARCGTGVSEFFVVGDETVCRLCKEQE